MRNVDLVKWFFTLKSAKGAIDIDLFEEESEYGFFGERDEDEEQSSTLIKSKSESRKANLLADRTFVDTVDLVRMLCGIVKLMHITNRSRQARICYTSCGGC